MYMLKQSETNNNELVLNYDIKMVHKFKKPHINYKNIENPSNQLEKELL